MKIETMRKDDIADWLELAREVEPLFGPMVGEPGFGEALMVVISENRAFAIRDEKGIFCGVIVISHENNEIEWLAVKAGHRQKGYGETLLRHAINNLDSEKPMLVRTFSEQVPEGAGARKLYLKYGFNESEKAGLNPAGFATAILRRLPEQRFRH